MELNEQSLEQILTRQREEHERHLNKVSQNFQRQMNEGLQENRRHVGVLVEDLEHKIQLIAEGHEALRKEMQEEFAAVRIENEATRKETQEEFAAVHTENEATRKEMRIGFAGVRTENEAIRLELEMMRSELSIIRRDLKEKVGRDEFSVLEARIAKLELSLRRTNS